MLEARARELMDKSGPRVFSRIPRASLAGLIGTIVAIAPGQQVSSPQDKKPNSLGPLSFRAHKVAVPPQIDGVIGPEEWANASTASKFIDRQHQPEQGKTTFYLQYDDKYVYFGAVIAESHRPKATATGTNVPFGIDDIFVLQLDTFGEGRVEGFNFCSINGRGATSFRKAGGSSQKREWRGSFEGAANIAGDGWAVEARVPWSILRIPKSGIRNLRFNFARTDSVTENPYWYYLAKDTENVSGAVWEGVNVPPVQTQNLWKFLPSVSAIAGDGKSQFRPSLDMRGFLNDKYEFSGVLFPDFSLVSRAATPLGFSHFEILEPETRPLFEEGSGYFDGAQSIFVTQRIRRFDFGGRFYGSPTPSMRIGVNSTIAFDGETTLAASLAGNQGPNRSYTLGFASLKSLTQPSNDAVSGTYYSTSGAWNFGAAGALTSDQEAQVGTQLSLSSNYYYGGFSARAYGEQIDGSFMPRLGYVSETGVRSVGGATSYSFSALKKWLTSAYISVSHGHTWTTGGRLAHESTGAFGAIDIKKAMSLGLDASSGSFGGTKETRLGFFLSFPNSNAPWSVSLNNSVSKFGDLDTDLRSLNLSYTDPGSRWAVSGGITQYTAEEVFIQRYLSLAYKLGPYDNLSLSMLNDQGQTNFAIQYARHNNKGIEYWFSFGDPSAAKFKPTIIARIAFPIK
ncbi:MAG: hypothetical protein H7Y17_16810 [Chlorobia bacterium]|nr:hypothetical protein [Fimbriimonadaceae bacterium]